MADRSPAAQLSGVAKSLFANALLLPPATLGAAVLARRKWLARRARGASPAVPPSPIRVVSLADFDAVFAPHPHFGPTLDCEVRFVGRGNMRVLGGASDAESWVLAVLAKRARRFFEFGTCTGKTSYLWAVNSPPDARIITLTLAPDEAAINLGDEDEAYAAYAAVRESVCTRFLYTGTEAEAKITQLFGDSKTFDETPYVDACDLVFVDGAHAYSYVVSDSEKALQMVRPGGVVLWHDYYAHPDHVPDVYRGLAELAERLPLVHLEGTALVAYRRLAA